ncbi:RimJ/RimL family protein N-acetyltransferase [Palleronia aestuarii]|uniref:RimJ/RimL family protein N-acetyltransferase n=1 Tax=Palleronia aestuarii TaxID=568105 RepID=A0A2W7NHZ2_9RHOB|nr:GNAT family N-acetyltransferase [Palleronia aestuarii]PZX19878.1 RimJ/RimL family protein N-acetyltransferase [Palleronia aestuarii]
MMVRNAQAVIRSERLSLRPLQRTDIPHLERYMGDARVAKATQTIPYPLPPGAVEAVYAAAHAEDRVTDCWAIDGTAMGRPPLVGVLTLEELDRGQSEIAYWTAPDAWGFGIASEAVQALVDANPYRANTIFAVVFQDNPASARVVTNAGFRWLGDAEAFCVARGVLVPTWTYSLKPR